MKLSRSRCPTSRLSGFAACRGLAFARPRAGCRQDMHNTPTAQPLRESVFFKDGSSARPLVEGTVARGTLQDDAAFFTGKSGAVAVDALPFPLTAEVLDRGRAALQHLLHAVPRPGRRTATG